MSKLISTTHVEEAQDSITLKLDAKGNYSWEIKVYFMTEATEMALRRVREIDQALREHFQGEGKDGLG